MRIIELFESDETRKFASQVYRKIIKTIPTYTKLTGSQKRPLVAYLTMKQLGIQECPDLAIGLGIIEGNENVTSEEDGNGVLMKVANLPFKYAIAFPVQLSLKLVEQEGLTPPQALQKILIMNKRTFVHEFTHYIDFNRFKGTYYPKSAARHGFTKYYNSPAEFNAFYNEAIHAMEEDKAYETIIQKPLREFVPAAFRFFERGFLTRLKMANRKKIIKKLALYWEEHNENK